MNGDDGCRVFFVEIGEVHILSEGSGGRKKTNARVAKNFMVVLLRIVLIFVPGELVTGYVNSLCHVKLLSQSKC